MGPKKRSQIGEHTEIVESKPKRTRTEHDNYSEGNTDSQSQSFSQSQPIQDGSIQDHENSQSEHETNPAGEYSEHENEDEVVDPSILEINAIELKHAKEMEEAKQRETETNLEILSARRPIEVENSSSSMVIPNTDNIASFSSAAVSNEPRRTPQCRYLVMRRIFLENTDKLMAVFVYNGYHFKTLMDKQLAKPVTTFIKLADVKASRSGIVNTGEENSFYNTNLDPSEPISLANLLILSHAEEQQFKILRTAGFQLFSAVGIEDVKRMARDSETSRGTMQDHLQELSENCPEIRKQLKEACAVSKTNPVDNGKYTYSFVQQTKYIKSKLLPYLRELINYGNVVHRHTAPIVRVPVQVDPDED